ncbi:MAG: SPASM domain-containing protein [Deltaproteobacteria bacterium]|nr:SPASM domain-containing protein [Deltaproteobacteria bacterium]
MLITPLSTTISVYSSGNVPLTEDITGLKDVFHPQSAEGCFSFGGVNFAVFGELKQFFVWGELGCGANVHLPILTEEKAPYVSQGCLDRDNLIRLIEKLRAVRNNNKTDGVSPERPLAFTRLYLDVSLECNLKCKYCYVARQRQGFQRLMTAETARATVNWLVRQRLPGIPLDIRFFGGEPLINLPVIHDLICFCDELSDNQDVDFRFFLSTNGILIDDACARFLADKRFSVKVSLDGDEVLHNQQRVYPHGAGSYCDTLRGIQNLQKYGLQPTLSVTSYNLSFQDVKRIAQSIAALGDFDIQWQTVSSVAFSYPASHSSDVDAEYEAIARDCWQAILCGDDTRLSFFASGIRKLADNAFDWRGCGAGFDSIMVSPDGSFHLCQRFLGLDDFVFGNVASECETERLQSLINKVLNQYHRQCKDCWLKYLCAKGCYYSNYLDSGNIATVKQSTCNTTRAYFKAVIWLSYMMALHLPNNLQQLIYSSTFMNSGNDSK